VVIANLDQGTLISSNVPLITTARTLFDPLGGIAAPLMAIVGIGALLSIMGADESGTIGSTQLAYAMSLDGLLPKSFARSGRRWGAPYVVILVLCITAFLASALGGLVGLINSSVFLLSFVYLCTCISTILLVRKYPERSSRLRGRYLVPAAGAACSLCLIVLIGRTEMMVSLGLMALGVPIYAFFSPKEELSETKAAFVSAERTLSRVARYRMRFLALPLHRFRLMVYRRKGIPPAFEPVPERKTGR
jgi:amino acid transporter